MVDLRCDRIEKSSRYTTGSSQRENNKPERFPYQGENTMFQIKARPQHSFVILLILAFCAISALLALTGCGTRTQAAPVAPVVHRENHVQVKLDIALNQPGMQKDWPAYSPNNLVVPANSLVTVTLHDYDLGNTAMPEGSPFTTVQGTVGGVAYLNGHPYTSLAPDKIAHTFTIPTLHLNVPFPGDGKEADIISFTFRTGKAGSYMFQCFDPCGTGSSGFAGPMASKGYMMGFLTVQ
jgi:heme/copper-type cytochrome/quinol oxidase subunit 2